MNNAFKKRCYRLAADLKNEAMRLHVIRQREEAAQFSSVAVETSTHCHRRCSYCPVSVDPKSKQYMDLDLFVHIVDNLSDLEFKGRFAYHFYNEPLLNKNLEEYVSLASQALPEARHLVYTSGDFLTEDRVRSLLAAGLDGFVVSDHGGRALTAPVKAAMGMFNSTPIRYRRMSDDRALFNRGGMVKVANLRAPKRCVYPAYELIIGIDGDVLLCCNDYHGENTFGNVRQLSIQDIWNSERMRQIRKELLIGRTELNICQICTGRRNQ